MIRACFYWKAGAYITTEDLDFRDNFAALCAEFGHPDSVTVTENISHASLYANPMVFELNETIGGYEPT